MRIADAHTETALLGNVILIVLAEPSALHASLVTHKLVTITGTIHKSADMTDLLRME